MKNVLTFIIFFAALIPMKIKAQGSWAQLATLPEGASVIDLTVDSNNVVYALTYFGSDIYFTANNGVSWTKMPGTYQFSNVNDIEIDKSTNTLYVGTLSRGLFWTSNMGVTWQDQPFYTNPNSGDHAFINRTVRKPASGIIICSEPGAFDSSVIYRSTNAGVSWNSSFVNFGGAYDFKYLVNGHLLAGTENGVFRSTDDGLTWTSANIGITNLKVSSILQQVSSAKIFAATEFNYGTNDTNGCGVFVSNDGGSTWTNSSNGMTDKRITCLSRDTISGTIYATYQGGVYQSVDNGQNWTSINALLGANDFTSIVANDSGLLLGSRKAGVNFASVPVTNWIERNSGISVSTISNMSMGDNGMIHVLDESNTGVYGLNGPNWTRQNNGLPSTSGRKIVKDHIGNMYVSYLSETEVLYKSTNQGASWTPITTLPLAPDIFFAFCSALKIDAANNVYAIVEFSSQFEFQPPQLYRSADFGVTWTLLYTMDAANYISFNDVDVSPDGTIYISLTDFGVETRFLYSSAGAPFSPLVVNISPVDLTADLVIAPNHSLYLVRDNKIYKRANIGQWNQVPSNPWPYDLNPITKLYIDNDNDLYVTSLHEGVYFSGNDGVSWINISQGLAFYTAPFSLPMMIHLYDLQFDTDNTVFAISTDEYSGDLMGIYKFTSALSTNEHNLADGQLLAYPNPVTQFCTIMHQFQDKNQVYMALYNVSGVLLKSFAPEHVMEANTLTFDMSSYPSGTYILKAIADNEISVIKIVKI